MDRELILSRQRGLTLVELLVVLTILAFMAGVVALNAPPPRSTAREEADRFAAKARAVYEEAVATSAPLALAFEPSSYRVLRYRSGEWTPAEDRRFAERRMPAGVALHVELSDASFANAAEAEDDAAEEQRLVVFDPLGPPQSFAVEFSGRAGRFRVETDAAGDVMIVKS